MTRDQVRCRIKELYSFNGKEMQIDTIWRVGCEQESMILVAKTGFGKGLLFETIPLLDPRYLGLL